MNRKLILLNFVLILVSSYCGALFLAYFHNIPFFHKEWIPTKILLTKQTNGAIQYRFTPMALSKNRLNLNAWHGFQELLYKDPLVPSNVEFEFLIEKGAYFNFVFNMTRKGFSGIRLGMSRRYPNLSYEASPVRKYISTHPLGPLGIQEGWNVAQIQFQGGGASLSINAQSPVALDNLKARKGLLGFRGSYRQVNPVPPYIDNVKITSVDPIIKINESFENTELFYPFLAGILLFIFFVNYFYYLGRQILGGKSNAKHVLLHGSILNATVMVLVLTLYGGYYLHFNGQYHPQVADYFEFILNKQWYADAKEINHVNRRMVEIASEMETAGHSDEYRILFLGSSQTWGSGATLTEGLVAETERVLNQEIKTGPWIRCVNAGISGFQSRHLYPHYMNKWIAYKPQLTLINLGHNDYNPEQYGYWLRKFIELNRDKNIKTVFVTEPNHIEEINEMFHLRQVEMIDTAKVHQIPLIHLHQHLLDNYDSGMLFWDQVHLTDFGHQLAGEFIADSLEKVILSDPKFQKRSPIRQPVS